MKKQSKLKVLLLAIGFVIVFILIFMILSQLKIWIPEKRERYAHGIIGSIAAFATLWLFLKYEKKGLKDYGLDWDSNTLTKFGLGMMIGVAIALVMIFSQVWISGLEITSNQSQNIVSFSIGLPAIVILAFMEEVAFRSYAFIKLHQKFGLRATQVVIAILFALYHIANGWSIGMSFLGPGIWSLAYGLSAVWSKGIAMPTGLHSGVNIILALFIGKQNMASLWVIDFPTEATTNLIKSNQNVGIILHLCLLFVLIIATEIYLRIKRTSVHSIYHSSSETSP